METTQTTYTLDFAAAAKRLQNVVSRTELQLNRSLSKKYQCNVYLKREDLQMVRSYKIRGA
jgi:threonine dehydratase